MFGIYVKIKVSTFQSQTIRRGIHGIVHPQTQLLAKQCLSTLNTVQLFKNRPCWLIPGCWQPSTKFSLRNRRVALSILLLLVLVSEDWISCGFVPSWWSCI